VAKFFASGGEIREWKTDFMKVMIIKLLFTNSTSFTLVDIIMTN
jgi:hypothetical protein